MTEPAAPEAVATLSTGVPGLDTVLGRGIQRGGLYMVEGPSGVGKTILASQMAFHQTAQGGTVVYVTLVAESHAKWIDQIAGLRFFDRGVFPDAFLLVSGYGALIDGGLDGLLALLGGMLSQRRPDFVVIEGFQNLKFFSPDELGVVQFVHRLNALVATIGCAALLVSMTTEPASQPEHGVIDGLIRLRMHASSTRRTREIEVVKLRSGPQLPGEHVLALTEHGIRVYPRLEAVQTRRGESPEAFQGSAAFGVGGLDAMLEGGLRTGTTTLLLGAPGAGKTLLGLKFLEAGVRQGEPALHFGFYEPPARLLAKAQRVGIDLRQAADDGTLRILWQAPLELLLDQMAYELLEGVRAHGTRRLFIDGVDGLINAAGRPERVTRFMTALTAELRAMGVTTLLTEELPVFAQHIDSRNVQASTIIDNVVVLRYVEIESRVSRLVSVLKTHDSGYDPSIREFFIRSEGIEVGESFTRLEGTLTGTATLVRRRMGDALPDPRGGPGRHD